MATFIATTEQAEELARCRYDVGHFARNYCWIRHPAMTFPIRFTPWDWQEGLLYTWSLGHNTISNKSRQIGWSWTALSYALWKLVFQPSVEIYLISANEVKAKSLMRKLRYMFSRLPHWMRPAVPARGADSKTHLGVRLRYWDDSRQSYEWANGFVSSLTTTGASGAGESATLVVADEVGLWKERQDDEATWAAVAPTTTHGGQLIVASTPRGYGGVFHRIWVNSITPLMDEGIVTEFTPFDRWNVEAFEYYQNHTGFVPLKSHYSMCYHDEVWLEQCRRGMSDDKVNQIHDYFGGLVYDQAWRDKQAQEKQLHQSLMLQEYELVFDKPGGAVFDSASLTKCYMPPKRFPEVAKAIAESEHFFIGVDSAEGINKANREPDYNSITALNEKAIQVKAIHNRELTSEWAGTTDVNPITGHKVECKGTVLLFIEQHLPCEGFVEKQSSQALYNRIEPHLPDEANIVIVHMTGELKRLLVKKTAYAIERGQLIVTNYFTLECMRQFISKGGGRYEAAPGFYDDPVISFMLAHHALELFGVYQVDLPALAATGERTIDLSEDELTPEKAGLRAAGIGPMMLPAREDVGAMVTGRRQFPGSMPSRSPFDVGPERERMFDEHMRSPGVRRPRQR